MTVTDQTTTKTDQQTVRVLPITQATAAIFADLFIGQTFLCFVHAGSKRVVCPLRGEMTAREGDLIILPAGSVITLENRPLLDASYRADGVLFPDDMIDAVFADQGQENRPSGILIVRADPLRPLKLLELIQETLGNDSLPFAVRQHRLLEPLIWLRHHGIGLAVPRGDTPLARVRGLIETDLERPWRAIDVARSFAMSEPTFRRWLAKSGSGFSKILQNTRLERGLALLQTTNAPVSQIALECGFKTPSHFADSFRKRFGIKPTAIRIMAE